MAQRKLKQDETPPAATVYEARSFDLSRLQGLSAKAIETHVAELSDPRGRLPAAGGPVGVCDLSA